MKHKLNHFKDRWQQLLLREKRILVAGIFFASILLFYALIWSPLNNKINYLQNKIHTDQQLLAWMQTADRRLSSLKNSDTSKKNNGSILSIIQTQLQKSVFSAQISGLRLLNDNAVQFHLQNSSFDQLITWLVQLNEQYSLRVSQLSVNTTETIGLVNADVVLV